jgi:hypothetical protein
LDSDFLPGPLCERRLLRAQPARLDEVEAHLRDVLDVMIAASEKMDRWE